MDVILFTLGHNFQYVREECVVINDLLIFLKSCVPLVLINKIILKKMYLMSNLFPIVFGIPYDLSFPPKHSMIFFLLTVLF